MKDPKSLDVWREAGVELVKTGRCLPWARGDWYLDGIRLARAIHDPKHELSDPQLSSLVRKIGEFLCTDQEWKSMLNCAVVCRAFPQSRRRDCLSFNHHETLASLPARDQGKWLDKCEEEQMSVADLRQQLRAKLRPPKVQPTSFYVLEAEIARMLRWLKAQDLGKNPDRRAAIQDALAPLVAFAKAL